MWTVGKHATNMFSGRAVLTHNEPKIVYFLDKHKDIACCSVDGVDQYSIFVETSVERLVQCYVHNFIKIFKIFYIPVSVFYRTESLHFLHV